MQELAAKIWQRLGHTDEQGRIDAIAALLEDATDVELLGRLVLARYWQQLNDEQQARYAHPQWLIKRLRKAWPEHWQSMLAANNERPPMTLRVNQRKGSRDDYLRLLADNGIAARAGELATTSIYLESPVAVLKLPGFSEGLVSVQDEASQLIPDLLQLDVDMQVLDACAAPGGKSCHILEHQPAVKRLLALDVEPRRLERLRENLQRLSLHADMLATDATQPQQWWDGIGQQVYLPYPSQALGGLVVRNQLQPDVGPALCQV